MKKIASVLSFFILCTFTAKAQDYNKIRFGFQASPSWSWMRTSDTRLDGTSSNWGIKFGAIGEYYFAPNYAMMAGIGFGINQGGTIQNGYDLGDFWKNSELSQVQYHALPKDAKLHYRINYVEIPFGLRLHGGSNEDASIKFYGEFPVFTLGFVSKALGDIRGINDPTTDEVIRDDVNGLSLSWGLGGGIEYEAATNATIFAGLFYQQGFTDVTSDKGEVIKNGDKIKEDSKGTISSLTLRVGVFF